MVMRGGLVGNWKISRYAKSKRQLSSVVFLFSNYNSSLTYYNLYFQIKKITERCSRMDYYYIKKKIQ